MRRYLRRHRNERMGSSTSTIESVLSQKITASNHPRTDAGPALVDQLSAVPALGFAAAMRATSSVNRVAASAIAVSHWCRDSQLDQRPDCMIMHERVIQQPGGVRGVVQRTLGFHKALRGVDGMNLKRQRCGARAMAVSCLRGCQPAATLRPDGTGPGAPHCYLPSNTTRSYHVRSQVSRPRGVAAAGMPAARRQKGDPQGSGWRLGWHIGRINRAIGRCCRVDDVMMLPV